MTQMTDIYGQPIDVHRVRVFRNRRELGVGYDIKSPAAWFVFDRDTERNHWHKHCGPYSTFDQARDWINGIREVRS